MSRLTVSVWGCSGLLCCPVLNEIFVHHPCLGAKGIESGGLENQPNEWATLYTFFCVNPGDRTFCSNTTPSPRKKGLLSSTQSRACLPKPLFLAWVSLFPGNVYSLPGKPLSNLQQYSWTWRPWWEKAQKRVTPLSRLTPHVGEVSSLVGWQQPGVHVFQHELIYLAKVLSAGAPTFLLCPSQC